jgi:hypothetical protein
MVFGKDLNKVLQDIDDKLGQSLGAMTVDSYGAGVAVGSAVWTAVPGLTPPEMVFGSQIKLTGARFVVVNSTVAANLLNLAIAKASAPGTPLTTTFDLTGASGEGTVTVLAETIIDADEELVVIEKDDLDVGFVAVADIQVVVEGNRVTT